MGQIVVKAVFNISTEMENIQREYHLEKEDVVLALQSSFAKGVGRDILVSCNEENEQLKILRVNLDGTMSPVGYKAFKKGKKELTKELSIRAEQKSQNRLLAMFTKGEIAKGRIFDKTSNGCFVVIKGERAFFPFSNGYQKEKYNGLYEIDNTLDFKIIDVKGNKITLGRKSWRIIKETICLLAGRGLKVKKRSDDTAVVYCSEPLLNDSQMTAIRATSPLKIVFKKEKRI